MVRRENQKELRKVSFRIEEQDGREVEEEGCQNTVDGRDVRRR